MLTAGCYITYNPLLINITSVVPNDTDNGGPWDPAIPISPEPGVWIVQLISFDCVDPDGEGDIRLARVTFQCQNRGEVDITIGTIPEFETLVGCDSGTYDPSITPNTVTITQNQLCTTATECEDGIYCNGQEICDAAGLCAPGPLPCDDGVECTIDTCDESSDTCVNTPDDANCDDGVDCTDDSCDEVSGCQNDPVQDGTNCDDGSYCTEFDVCESGICAGTGNPCPVGYRCLEGVDGPICEAIENDSDYDGITDSQDNCLNHPNGPVLGTCTSGPKELIGIQTCTVNPDCDPDGFCSMNQEDMYPPGGNSIGDACECEGNFDYDQDQDGSDAATFKEEFGRSSFNDACTEYNSCIANFDNDQDVDGVDAVKFKEDFGRSPYHNICPPCADGSCAIDADCDDGQYCNGLETCNTVTCSCQAGTPPNCDDGVDCTEDSCDDETGACVNISNDENCPDDGLYCNGEELCDPAKDCFHTGDPCPAGTVCNEDTGSCDPVGGCTADSECEDGLYCNGEEICDAGICLPGQDPCDDGNICTLDLCDDFATPHCLLKECDESIISGPGHACCVDSLCVESTICYYCEGNFDCDQDVDGSDAVAFKTDFGRSPFDTPCTNENTCNGDFDCDKDVDGADAKVFRTDFGRSAAKNPCPECVIGEWCVYP
jgi:hypothetical protein